MTHDEFLDLVMWLLPLLPLLFVIACAIVVFFSDRKRRRGRK